MDITYASNFNAGTVDVFNHNFGPATLGGPFKDPNIPSGYAGILEEQHGLFGSIKAVADD